MEKGEFTMQEALLQSMFFTFSGCLDCLDNKAELERNYQKQLECYSAIFESNRCDDDDAMSMLICARCLISATRSLLCGGYLSENIQTIKKEVAQLSPIFNSKRLSKSDVSKIVNNRISSLAPKKSDEMIDAVLFMCFSLSAKNHTEEKRIESCVL